MFLGNLFRTYHLSRTEALKEMKAKLGDDKYNGFLDSAAQGLKFLEKNEEFSGLLDWVESSGVGDDPTFLKLMSYVGSVNAEDSIPKGSSGANFKTADQLHQEIAQLRSNKAWLDRNHPEHKTVVSRLEALHNELSEKTGSAMTGAKRV